MFCQNRSRRFYNNVPYIDVLPKSIAQTKPNNRRSIKLGAKPLGKGRRPWGEAPSWAAGPSETARDNETNKPGAKPLGRRPNL